ncbi:MAG: spore coat U domain-containing protein [Pararobbsia sp.]
MLFVVLSGAAPQARADSCSASMSSVSFGAVTPITRAASQANGTLTVTCNWLAVTLTPRVLVCLNLAAASPRTLKNGAGAIQYDLYQDPAYSIPWGSTTLGTTPVSVTLKKPLVRGNVSVSTSVTIYGRIAANQPTVPTVGNSSTVYVQDFSAADTMLNADFYLLIPPSCATAGGSTGAFTFEADATVLNSCNVSATNVAFGAAGLLDSALNATGSLNVQCTNNDAYRIALDGGASASVAARNMRRPGGGTVGYQLYLDSAHTAPWGDGSGGTSMATFTGTGSTQTIPVYGVVPAQKAPAPGNYSDTITATISF